MTDQLSSESTICDQCGLSLVMLSTPHVARKCKECGKITYLVEAGDTGGIHVREGDRLTIPAGHIRISLDPSQSTGVLLRPGITWVVHQLYASGQVQDQEQFDSTLSAYSAEADRNLKTSPLLKHLNIEDPATHAEVWKILEQNQDKAEWWAALIFVGVAEVRKAISENAASKAAWLMNRLDVFRSLLLFQKHLEPLAWQGYTSRRLRDVLGLWKANNDNEDEEFWQKLLSENALILSQLFAFPIVVLQGKGYLGGKGIENTGAKLLDFLVANQLTTGTALIEIKTPKTRLLGGEYRSGVYAPSPELGGAVAQVLNYKDTFVKNYHNLVVNSEKSFRAFDPQCFVIVGNFGSEMLTREKHASFDLYRNALRGVQIVTYDEVFTKVEIFLSLLGG